MQEKKKKSILIKFKNFKMQEIFFISYFQLTLIAFIKLSQLIKSNLTISTSIDFFFNKNNKFMIFIDYTQNNKFYNIKYLTVYPLLRSSESSPLRLLLPLP